MLALAACGHDEQRLHGEIEHEGTVVTYESWYHPPSLGERFNKSNGIATRITVDNKTLLLIPGVGYPDEWDQAEDGQLIDYPPAFWQGLIDKFDAIPVEKDRKDDFHAIKEGLKILRDTVRSMPGDALTQGLTSSKPAVPVYTGTDPVETEAEAELSRQVGAEAIKAHEEEQLKQGWSSGSIDIRRAFNRGKRKQVRVAGFEFRQSIELYKQHTMLTKYDHSGTIATTFHRLAGSNGAWVLLGKPFVACNHGDCPRTGDMRHYETCDSGVAADWCSNDAECEGNWMSSHLCNDDTSMQINNAQGVWTGNKCPGGKRGIAPHCGRQYR